MLFLYLQDQLGTLLQNFHHKATVTLVNDLLSYHAPQLGQADNDRFHGKIDNNMSNRVALKAVGRNK
jgi:hypothetical protein